MITAIFNMSLSTGTCPVSWKSSLIVPVPKSGDSSNPGNYLPPSHKSSDVYAIGSPPLNLLPIYIKLELSIDIMVVLK